MSSNILVVLAAAVGFATPVLAQVADPTLEAKGYADAGSPNAAAINAREAPVTAGLNAQANAGAVASVDAQAQYEVDRAAYLDALVRHDAAVDRADARYARQQRAYADAMAAWRVQVQACRHGSRRACDMPPPNVADFY